MILKLLAASLLLTSCFASAQTGLVNRTVGPSSVCQGQTCTYPVLDLPKTQFGFVQSLSGSNNQRYSYYGICSGSCSAPGALPDVGSWTGYGGNGVQGTLYANFQVGPSPATLGLVGLSTAQSLVNYFEFNNQAQQTYDKVKEYTEKRSQFNAQVNSGLQKEVSAIRDWSEASMVSAMNQMGRSLLSDPTASLNLKALKSLQDFQTLGESPFHHSEGNYQGIAIETDLAAAQAALKSKDYEGFVQKTDDLENSNGQAETEKTFKKYIRDGVFRPEAVDPQLGYAPFSVTGFTTLRSESGGQELRRVANRYQIFWLDSKGLTNISSDDVTSYVIGAHALRDADSALSAHQTDHGYGLLQLANTLLDVSRGVRFGVTESLKGVVRLAPQMAQFVMAYAEAKNGRPGAMIALTANYIANVPEAAEGFVNYLKVSYGKLKNGTAFERGEVIGRLAVDYFVARIAGEAAEGMAGRLAPGSSLRESMAQGIWKSEGESSVLLGTEAEAENRILSERANLSSQPQPSMNVSERTSLIKQRLAEYPEFATEFQLDSPQKIETLARHWNEITELRQDYVNEVRTIAPRANQLVKEGKSLEEAAQWAYSERTNVGMKYKELTPSEARDIIYARNQGMTGYNSYGPRFEYLLAKYNGAKEEVLREIIESSSRPNGNINSFFGLGVPK